MSLYTWCAANISENILGLLTLERNRASYLYCCVAWLKGINHSYVTAIDLLSVKQN